MIAMLFKIGVVFGAYVLLCLLGYYAAFEEQESEEQEKVAERQRKDKE